MRDTFEENKLVKVGAVWWLHTLVGWSDLGLVGRRVGWRPAGQVSCLLMSSQRSNAHCIAPPGLVAVRKVYHLRIFSLCLS